MAARGPRIDDYLPEAARLDWTCEPAPMSAADEERKLAAVGEYGSQMKTFCGFNLMLPFQRRAHRVLGGEPIWTGRPRSQP